MIEAIFTWALMALSVAGTLLVIRRRVLGYYLWVVSNIGWIAVDFHRGVYAQALLFFIYLALSVYGIWDAKNDSIERLRRNRA